MLYLFLLILGLLGGAVYLVVFFKEVPGALEERLGRWEELPSELGVWRIEAGDAESSALQRETRLLLRNAGGLFSSDKLIRQVRYRDRQTGKITHVERDEILKRKRVKG